MVRWQRPYLDVPADDYLSNQDFLLRWGYPLDHVPDLHRLITYANAPFGYITLFK